MTAIPTFLLPHSVLLRRPVSGSVWGPDSPQQAALLTRVRVELKTSAVSSGVVGGTRAAGTLYYDCRHSRPADVSFQVGDVVEFLGREYAVSAVRWLCGRGARPHHAELTLV